MAIWFCRMEFNCPKQWDKLAASADPLARDYEERGKPFDFVDSQGGMMHATKLGALESTALQPYVHIF